MLSTKQNVNIAYFGMNLSFELDFMRYRKNQPIPKTGTFEEQVSYFTIFDN